MLALLAFALVLTTNPPAIQLSVAGAGGLDAATPSPSAWSPCRRRCSAWPSASACRWPLPRRWAAANGRLGAIGSAVPPYAWWLLLGNLFWVLAYDTEYAMVDRDDDLKIGIKTSA